jgi:hypothetical protein
MKFPNKKSGASRSYSRVLSHFQYSKFQKGLSIVAVKISRFKKPITGQSIQQVQDCPDFIEEQFLFRPLDKSKNNMV